MKRGLFILSVTGFVAAAYNLIVELKGQYSPEHLIYIFMIAVLMSNCAIGILMTYHESFPRKRKLKLANGRYAIKK